MKNRLRFLLLGILCLNLTAYAQPGSPSMPQLGGVMDKLFCSNSNFSASMETQTKMASTGETIAMSGTIFFANGKSRSEMDMTQMKGGKMSSQTIERIKSMGMDKVVTISRPDKKVIYMIYPGMQSYAEITIPDAKDFDTNDFKAETTELGKETVDGHPCVKKQSVVTGKKNGIQMTMLYWNATDLENCPIKVEQTMNGNQTTMSFKNINLSKPAASLFEPPSDYTKYDSMQALMQEQMMKHMGGGGMGFPLPTRGQQ